MNFLFSLIFLTFWILSCTTKQNDIVRQSSNNSKELDSDRINYIKDSIRSDSLYGLFDYSKWYTISDYFSVYKFSDTIIGIGIEIGDGTHYKEIDNLINFEFYHNYSTKRKNDLLNYLNLSLKNIENDHFRRSFSEIDFNIICQKGIARAKAIDAFIASGECNGMFIIRLTNIDFEKFGEPLIASKKRINLNQAGNLKYDKLLIENYKNEIKNADYFDTIPPKYIGESEGLIFAYSDDFKWYLGESKSNVFFPERIIFKQKNNSLERVWSNCLDLFGIPCD